MLEFTILGPLEVRVGDRLLPIAGFRQRALLAMLLLNANDVVSADRLLEELWGCERRTDTSVLRVRISQLRKLLDRAGGGSPIETRAPGYVLSLAQEQLDLGRFNRLAEEGSSALQDDPAGAVAKLREALAFWRGPPLAEFAYELFAQTAIGRLEETRLATLEKRIDAELALGLGQELVGELQTLVAEHPLREHLCGQLMLAFYRAGRQVEALDVFRERRALLLDELGIEPGPALQELQRAILAQDAALDQTSLQAGLRRPSESAAPTDVVAAVESRKIVTVLVCEVVEAVGSSTRPDAEVMRDVRERYVQTSSEVLIRHGGTVERFVGDAIMAVFGTPVAHEDDVLRAVRAAVDLRKRLADLTPELDAKWGVRLAARVGLETGEVLAREVGSGRTALTGEVVRVAARLQQAAEVAEIIMGELAWSLVRSAVSAEFANMVTLAGTGEEVAAWRLLDVNEDAPSIPRRLDTPFVGRARELAQLRGAYERAVRERVRQLFTVLGEPGIGKTRFVREARVDLLTEARVLVGRCLPYGEGVTYAPLREIVSQAVGDSPVDALPLLLADETDGERIALAVTSLLGLVPARVPLEEAFRGVRRLCETLAQPRPLVLVFEDVHWAKASMLDLIEYLADGAGPSPLLLLCLARQELLDTRPGWGGGKVNGSTLMLGPLSRRESELLAGRLTQGGGEAGATHRVCEIAQGNPLFVEQLVAMLAEGSWTSDELRLPATVEALLAARLELLGPAARLVLERASVLGDRFRAPMLARLVPTDVRTALPGHLRALVRKELLHPTRLSGGDDGYRFRHVLVREAAYRRLPKAQRADLHERCAERLATDPADTGGRDEVVGYHFERAHGYVAQLGNDDARVRRLAERASTHLAAAASEAFARTDFRAVDQLLARATALMTTDNPRLASLLYDRGTSLGTLGRPREADVVLAKAIEVAHATGDPRSEWRARLDRVLVRNNEPSLAMTILDQARTAREAVSVLGKLGDDRGLVRAWLLAASVAEQRGRVARQQAAAERMLHHAQQSGVYREEAWALWTLAHAILLGPTPAEIGIRRCEALLRGRGELRVGDVGVLGTLALLRAMQGDFDQGRRLIAEGRDLMEGLGHNRPLLATMCWRGEVELIAHDWAAADDALREACDLAAASGSEGSGGYLSGLRARALQALGRRDAADECVRVARTCAPPANRAAQASWRSVRATLLAARGDMDACAAAVELASEAVRILRATEFLTLRADVFLDLAAALHASGDITEAARAAEQGRVLYERKGHRVAARRVRETARLATRQA